MKRSQRTKRSARFGSTGTVEAATEILAGHSEKRGLARLLPFLGPAFIASVAYMDPGNFATNIQGGAAVRLHAAVGDRRQQPDGHADPDALGQAGHRHRHEPGRAVPRPLSAPGGAGPCGC